MANSVLSTPQYTPLLPEDASNLRKSLLYNTTSKSGKKPQKKPASYRQYSDINTLRNGMAVSTHKPLEFAFDKKHIPEFASSAMNRRRDGC